MCGICGFVTAREALPKMLPARLPRMLELLEHRGPDEQGTRTSATAAVGARRLSIVDLKHGAQPMANETGDIWCVQNGELYNHLDIRRQLQSQGHALRTQCDTEILPHLYEQYGTAYASRLTGEFATAVWDEKRGRLVLARDRLGVKPLYYAVREGVLVFASELKAVLASGWVGTSIDDGAVASLLDLGFVPEPATLLEEVRVLPPGHSLVFDAGGFAVTPYWTYPRHMPNEQLSESDHLARIEEELRAAVKRRLMADVPVGALLSGGLDSALLVALMTEESTHQVKTFSVGLRGSVDELPDARIVAQRFGTDHHELSIEPPVGDDVDDLVWHLDQPIGDVSALAMRQLSKATSQHVKVVLSGQGADELFAGYRKHGVVSALQSRWGKVLSVALGGVPEDMPGALGHLARFVAADSSFDRVAAAGELLTTREAESILRPDMLAVRERVRRQQNQRFADVSGSPLAQMLQVDAQLALPGLMLRYFDKMSMAESLEVRLPYLDPALIAAAADLPDRLRIQGMTRKVVLRRIGRDLLPDETIAKKKVGFMRRATAHSLASPGFRLLTDELLGPSASVAKYVDLHAVRTAHARNSRIAGDGRLLYTLLLLEIWLTSYLPRATRGQSAVRAA